MWIAVVLAEIFPDFEEFWLRQVIGTEAPLRPGPYCFDQKVKVQKDEIQSSLQILIKS